MSDSERIADLNRRVDVSIRNQVECLEKVWTAHDALSRDHDETRAEMRRRVEALERGEKPPSPLCTCGHPQNYHSHDRKCTQCRCDDYEQAEAEQPAAPAPSECPFCNGTKVIRVYKGEPSQGVDHEKPCYCCRTAPAPSLVDRIIAKLRGYVSNSPDSSYYDEEEQELLAEYDRTAPAPAGEPGLVKAITDLFSDEEFISATRRWSHHKNCDCPRCEVYDKIEAIKPMLSQPTTVAEPLPFPVSSQLCDLLAVIHRDGGHYQAAHGTAKAVEDAMQIVSELRTAEPGPAVAEGVMCERTLRAAIKVVGGHRCQGHLRPLELLESRCDNCDRIHLAMQELEALIGTPTPTGGPTHDVHD